MDQIERRCAGLMALLHRLNPEMDLEDMLDSNDRLPGAPQDSNSSRTSPSSMYEFEWSEAPVMSPAERRRSCLDGMASLPTANTEAGYLGRLQSCFQKVGSNICR